MKFWLSWKLYGIGDHIYIVRSLLCVWTFAYWCISLHNQICHPANYNGLKIFLIFFCGVVFSILRDLQISFRMPSLDALISLPLWPWTPPCPTSLIRFGLSRSTILSWGGTDIMHLVSMLTTMCWRMTLATSWCTKENCTYHRVLQI